jgi:hypothetical protein
MPFGQTFCYLVNGSGAPVQAITVNHRESDSQTPHFSIYISVISTSEIGAGVTRPSIGKQMRIDAITPTLRYSITPVFRFRKPVGTAR